MPDIQIEIGGRTFTVACQEGEEGYLQLAARMLDTEASVILGQIGRMPTDRMLLMAGLMLADKTAGLEEDLSRVQSDLDTHNRDLKAAQDRVAELEAHKGPDQVTVIPSSVTDGLAELAARAEALADALDGSGEPAD